jgi:hypothetical protein
MSEGVQMALVRFCALALAAGLLGFSPAFAADAQFYSTLDPAAMTMATRANVAGTGEVHAEVTGSKLTVSGSFTGLASAATGAHLRAGLMTGVPGDAFADLTVTQADSGTVSGTVTLTRAQLQALKAGAVYVQIDSVKAPDGNLRGWLLAPKQ